MRVGYARVSTFSQETRLQLDAFRDAGITRVFWEKRSGVAYRPRLNDAIDSLASGDVLVVWKIDRIARGLLDLLRTRETLKKRGAGFQSLTEPIDTTTPLGEFVFQILGSVAQLERSMIRERAIAGQLAAYRAGVRWGGTLKKLTAEDEVEIRALRATGFYTIPVLASMFEVSESTICRTVGSRSSKAKLPVLGPLLDEAE